MFIYLFILQNVSGYTCYLAPRARLACKAPVWVTYMYTCDFVSIFCGKELIFLIQVMYCTDLCFFIYYSDAF